MKVGVTGGAGFIGSSVARRLRNEGLEVVVVDDLSTGLISNLDALDVDLRVGSVSDGSFVATALDDCDRVIHLAALGSVPRSVADPSASFLVNALGTLNVLEVCRDLAVPVTYSSSSSVYGLNGHLPKDEDMWCQPTSPYGASKLAAESLALAFQSSYQLPVLVLRFFNVYGPSQRADHSYAAVIPRFVEAAIQGKPLEVHGDGLQSRDFTFIDTIVDLLYEATTRGVTSARPVNVAFGRSTTILEVAEILESLVASPLKISYSPRRTGDIKHSLNSPENLRSLFPDLREVELREGLEKTIEWMRQSRSS